MAKIEEIIRRQDIEFVDLKYVGLLGRLHHITIPSRRLRDAMRDGVGIDGSSIPGYKGVKRCDMIIMPDVERYFIDPCFGPKTLSFLCRSYYSYDRSPFEKDPRGLVSRLEGYLQRKGFEARFLPELEFYLFNEVDFADEPGRSYFRVVSEEGLPNAEHPHQGLRIRPKGGYHVAPPFDRTARFRNELAALLQRCGIEVKYHHHEVGPATQVEIELVFDGVGAICDAIALGKYLIRNHARSAGLTATFMPKPLYGEPGNGMHVHHYLLKDGKPVLFDRKDVSRLARLGEYYVAGLLDHAPALCALTNPSTNSYKRLISGYEAPTYTDCAVGSRASAIRIPEYVRDPRLQRIEYRIPDAMANPFLALPAIVLAGLDGVERRLAGIGKKKLPGNLLEALNELKKDHEFLLKGGVFTEELLMQWVEIKTMEFEAVANRPTAQEYLLYFGE